jgi:hypothetical protein
MPIVIDVLATVAALCTAVIFGTDVLTAVVLRPALAEIDDHALVQITGRTHRFGDQRLPLPGILSVVAAAATAVAAFIGGSAAAGVFAAIGLALLGLWLLLFNRISLPINRVLIAASNAGETPANARELQDRWESIITVRAVLQGLALAAFCVAIALGAR